MTKELEQTANQLRVPATVLLVCGLLLLLLGQAAYAAVPKPEQNWVLLLTAVGAIAFLFGGQLAVRGQVPQPLINPVKRLTHFFQISIGQLTLLFFAPCFAILAALTAGKQLLARHAPVSLSAWILAILFVVIGSLRFDEARIRLPRKVFWLTAVLFGVALFLRGVATAQIPTTFSGDEGSAALFGLLLLRGESNNLLSLGWFSFPALYFAVQSFGIVILGQTIEAVRIGSAVAGALTIIVVYWLGRSMFGWLTGAFAAIYLAASHYHIHMSRIALNNIWDGLFGTVAILGLWDGWKHGRRLGFVLCGLALGLGQYFYVSIRIMPLIFMIWATFALIADRDRFRQRLPDLLLTALIALIVFLPLGILFAQHPDEFSAPLNRVTILGDRLVEMAARNGRSPAAILLDQAFKGAQGFTHLPLRLLYDPGVPLLLPAAAALFILGLLWGILHFDLRYLLLFLPLLAAIISNAISQDPPASQRYVMAIPIVAIFIAVPLAQVVAWLRQLWPSHRRLALVLPLLLLMWLVIADLGYYFTDVYDRYTLGGGNTTIVHEIAHYLRDHDIPEQQVYFFGFPRIGYYSLSTIPYLAPQMQGIDVNVPLLQAPDWQLNGPTLFLFLPERAGELDFVRAAYPAGITYRLPASAPQPLFVVYEVAQ